MATPNCIDCLDVVVEDEDLVAYQSDRDIPSDISENESDEEEAKKSDEEHHSDEKQSDEEAETIYRYMYGSDSESEGEDTEVDPNMPKVRRRRFAKHWRRRKPMDTSYVKMPTGNKHRIITPKPGQWNCNKKTLKVTLHYNKRQSRREYRIVQREMDKTIVPHPGQKFKRYKIIKIQKLINGCLWKRYLHRQEEIRKETHFVNQRMLFHGSANVKDILNNGFNEQYASTTGMFGAGLYFAKQSSKANQYCFGSGKAGKCQPHQIANCFKCVRQMLLCRVTLGKNKNEYKEKIYAHPPVGYNSVIGVPSKLMGGLKYPEYIVYRREQVYPEFLITYRISN